MKILITGGAGFIGSNLTLALTNEGHSVTAFDSLGSQIHGEDPETTSPLYRSILGKARFLRASVLSREAWIDAVQGQDAIVHLAAETGTGQSMYEIQRYIDTNVGGTGVMLDVLANERHTVRKVVVASSRAVHGEGRYRSRALGIIYPDARTDADMKAGIFEPLCPGTREPLERMSTDEESKVHPTSVYGITKQSQEQLVMTVCRALAIPATALRYQNVYGPGQSLNNPYTGIMSIFSTRLISGKSINIFEDGKESRDFVFIDDVIDATMAALFLDGSNGEVFGIGSGVPTSVVSLAQTLAAQYNSDSEIQITGAYRLGDIRHNFADISKARRLLDFCPKMDLQKGVRRFATWVKAQAVRQDNYERSLEEMKARGLFKS